MDYSKIKTIEDFNLKGKRVFLRVDFNVPLNQNQEITDDTRIRESIPTIQYAIRKGAKLIIASHLGRPKGSRNPKYSLQVVGEKLSELLDRDVLFSDNCTGDGVKKITNEMNNGEIIMLENLRFHKAEEENDSDFSAKLASYADIYINDAFGTSHRKHASVYGVPSLMKSKGCGYLMKKEINYLEKAINTPKRPFIAIIGGAKVSDKIKVIENLLFKVDVLLIGGAMAYTFLAARKINTGKSLIESDQIPFAKNILAKADEKKLLLKIPTDHIISKSLTEYSSFETTENAEIPSEWMGVDIGPKTISSYVSEIMKAKTVLWNGPMGIFELMNFSNGTMSIAKAIADSKSISIVGGGDSASAVHKSGVADKISHISTGGGASLEFIEGTLLPGIEILTQ